MPDGIARRKHPCSQKSAWDLHARDLLALLQRVWVLAPACNTPIVLDNVLFGENRVKCVLKDGDMVGFRDTLD